jgi:hypothetical protein
MTHVNAANERLAQLRKREATLREAIARQLALESKRKAKQHLRLVNIVGQAVLDQALQTPDSELMLKQILKTADIEERSRKFLQEMRWL